MGRSLLAFPRARVHEAELLIGALHDRGIPTWEDLKALDEEHAERAIRRNAEDSATSNAILWLTPEMKSDRIHQLETGWILERVRQQAEQDCFFAVPVLAGGLASKQVGDVIERRFSIEDLRLWNLSKVNVDPIGPREAAKVARRVLDRRVAAIHRSLPEEERFQMELFTRPTAVFKPGIAFIVDWVDRFEGRLPRPGAWEQFLLPALNDIAAAVQGHGPGRGIEISGLAAVPVATAVGCTFLGPRGVKVFWRQSYPEHDDQLWSLRAAREASGFHAEVMDRDPNARDVAVLVSVAANVETAFEASLDDLPAFRGVVHVTKPGFDKHVLENAGQAHDVAQIVIEGMRNARNRYRQVGCIHLFMSVPVGLAMMIGQLLNTFGLVQTYEHIPNDGVGCYRPAMLLYPSG
jgi:hypothetical protein